MNGLQKQTIQAIVNVFETGAVLGDYSSVTLLEGDSGHLTYGRSQASLASGNLHRLVKSYCEAPGAACATALSPFLERLLAKDMALDRDPRLRKALEQAGCDPVMRQTQDQMFDRAFFEPAQRAATRNGLEAPLSRAVVYDSFIHGSWERLRKKTTSKAGPVGLSMAEERWVSSYVDARRDWLAAAGGVLAKCVYRMDAFRDLISAGKWQLELPLRICGTLIDEAALNAPIPRRAIRLENPYMSGGDVSELQGKLAARGFSTPQDGVFDTRTEESLKAFQTLRGLAPDGVAGPRTWAALAGQAKAAGL